MTNIQANILDDAVGTLLTTREFCGDGRTACLEMLDLIQLRKLRRGEYHAGYVWAAIMDDGELVCEPCVRQEYTQIYKSTYAKAGDGWQCVGVIGSDTAEETAYCAHCNKPIWEVEG